jgi:hypothetical protein
MKALFKKEELEYLSANFILSLPEASDILEQEAPGVLKDYQTCSSQYHQNHNKKQMGGFYKSITRLME